MTPIGNIGTFRRLGAMTMCAVLFSLPFVDGAQAAGAPSERAPGTHRLTLTRANGPTVEYAIQIPDGYSAANPVPLVLALHFGGNPQGAGASLLQILVGPGLEDLGAIIVAPDSVNGNWSPAENEAAANDLLDTVISQYAIDEEKIVITGYCMGGAGTWSFAAKFPERFSAAIPVAGRPTPSAAGWQLPVLAIHSREDLVMPYLPTRERIDELKSAGVNADLILLTNISHYETYRFQDALQEAVTWLRTVWE
jgi:predicted peptidase